MNANFERLQRLDQQLIWAITIEIKGGKIIHYLLRYNLVKIDYNKL